MNGCVFEALPDERQRAFFAKSFGCKRMVKNHYLEVRQNVYHKEKRSLSPDEYKRLYLPVLKKEKPYLCEPDKFVYECALADADRAYVNFFEGRGNFPKYTSKNKPNGNSYTTRYTNNNIRIFKGKDGLPYIKLPKAGANIRRASGISGRSWRMLQKQKEGFGGIERRRHRLHISCEKGKSHEP